MLTITPFQQTKSSPQKAFNCRGPDTVLLFIFLKKKITTIMISVNWKLFIDKYEEMKQQGINVDFLDKEQLGGIKLYINQEPLRELFHLKANGDDVYIGTN